MENNSKRNIALAAGAIVTTGVAIKSLKRLKKYMEFKTISNQELVTLEKSNNQQINDWNNNEGRKYIKIK